MRQVITASVKGFADCFSSPHGHHSRKTIPQGKTHSPVPISHSTAMSGEKPVVPIGGETHYHKQLIKSQPALHGRGLMVGQKKNKPSLTSEGNTICLCVYLKG